MKVLIVGNSVSQPPFPGAQSYPQLLGERLGPDVEIETIIGSGETIEQLEPAAISALATPRDRVVLHIGINECAPRPLSVAERARLSALRPKWLQRQIIRVIHRFRPNIIRVRPLHQFTPLPAFQLAVQRVLTAARSAGARVLVLPITTVTATAEQRTPFTNREVARYNAALLALASSAVHVATQREIFGSDEATPIVASPETVHLSPSAHAVIADYVAAWLDARSASTREA